MHQSIATIDSPEFINLQPLELNPLMSSCEIKVLYLGENRNHSFITKEVATEMAKTLRGAPIVGYYREEKQDFADHGQKVVIEGNEVKFECKTKPYGFVSPDAKVWFQKFEDYDDFGKVTEREYLMTTGYLWTGQYEECKSAVSEGRPHSMELDDPTLSGQWTKDKNSGVEFFIINDAIFSKLCILGDNVEPCFEGSSVTKPNVSSKFNLDNTFKNTLFNMMQDLNFALQGGKQEMENLETPNVSVENTENTNTEFTAENNDVETANNNNVDTPSSAETSFEKKKEEEEKKEDEAKEKDADSEKKPEEKKDEDKKDDEDEKKKPPFPPAKHSLEDETKFNAIEAELSDLKAKYSAIEEECVALRAFKAEIESKKKDELIGKFTMLTDAEKQDVIDNKDKYTYDEIESKLSVICVRNQQVNFDLEKNAKNEKNTEKQIPDMTFNLGGSEIPVPEMVQALRDARKNNNY